MAVDRIARLSFTSADAARLADFYEQAFGSERVSLETRDPTFARLLGLEAASVQALSLRIGAQTIEFLQFTQSGSPYPRERSSNDRIFQHIAIVVADMQAAYAQLTTCRGWTPITTPAPQLLPPSSGSVHAFKFRDPEGHPLELLQFPPDNLPPAWRAQWSGALHLGIDHSAIVVANTARSVDFYQRLLGFRVSNQSLNRGPAQERLDYLRDVLVEVTGLAAPAARPPHLELLSYRAPPAREVESETPTSNDIAAARVLLDVYDVIAVINRLDPAQVRLVGERVPTPDGDAALLLDPDGHALLLQPYPGPVGMH